MYPTTCISYSRSGAKKTHTLDVAVRRGMTHVTRSVGKTAMYMEDVGYCNVLLYISHKGIS